MHGKRAIGMKEDSLVLLTCARKQWNARSCCDQRRGRRKGRKKSGHNRCLVWGGRREEEKEI
jgi:hypothetical protein